MKYGPTGLSVKMLLCLWICLMPGLCRIAAAEVLYIPDGVQAIESQAFADCAQVEIAYVPALCTVAEDAFPDRTIVVHRGEFALQPTLRRLTDAQISALASSEPAQMRAAISTYADAKALIQLLFPEVNCRVNASLETEANTLRLSFPAPEQLLRQTRTDISEIDIDHMMAYLLADDAPCGNIIALAPAVTAQAAFGWLDGQLLYPQSVAWVQTAEGLMFISIHGTEELWTVTHPSSFHALPEGNFANFDTYAQAVMQNGSICALISVPSGSGFAVSYSFDDGSW